MISISEERMKELLDYQLPTYKEIPAVGLYLDQTSKYLNEVLSVLPGCVITNSMISNYVKHHIISNPIRKQYSRDQIASLIFITVAKRVLPLDDVSAVLARQQEVCSVQQGYDYFSRIFEDYLHKVFNNDLINDLSGNSDEEILVKRIILTVVNQLYLEESFNSKQ